MTMCDFRTKHSQEVRKILEKNFPKRLYNSYIRTSVSLKEASSQGMSVFEYAPHSTGAFDYQNAAEEFLRDHKPARLKREYYEDRFQQLSIREQEEIVNFAQQSLSSYNRSRLDYLSDQASLQEALLIERNKILEKIYPHRKHASQES